MEGKAYYTRLLEKYIEGTSSPSETADLMDELDRNADTEEWQLIIREITSRATTDPAYSKDYWETTIQRILSSNEDAIKAVPVHRVHFLKTAWFRYAAAIIIVFGLGTYLFVSNQKEKPSVTQTNPVPVQNDVAPGGNRATLTLTDGSKIVLDSAANGALADQGSSAVIKKDNQIIYEPGLTPHASRLTYNTMSTPRGGQYQLTLPDGTKVWLNAESSITYPTAFTEKQRRVTITGEAYFEVAKDKSKPFIVSTGEGRGEKGEEKALQIEVLGTHFNINSYTDEPSKSITLLEGSVRLKNTSSLSLLPSPRTTVLTLTPGQQGQLKDQRLSLASNPNLDQVMAWKNGAFNFEKMELAKALREISRWYDVEIIYSNGVPEMTIGGGMGRDLNLSEVLKVLEGLGVKAKLEQKKLYISK